MRIEELFDRRGNVEEHTCELCGEGVEDFEYDAHVAECMLKPNFEEEWDYERRDDR